MKLLVPLAAMAATALAHDLPVITPAEAGLDPAPLAELSALIQTEVTSGRIPGVVAAVLRHGSIAWLESFGETPPDALFRIASMTKAITSVGVMMLVEEGAVTLDDPISRHLPAFAAAGGETAGITLHQLLTHTSGLGYGLFGPEEQDRAYVAANLTGIFLPQQETMADHVARLAAQPLGFKPGTAWNYSQATDVLGHLLEAKTGLTLDRFFHERIFLPLGMHDTHFLLPEEKADRLATLYTPGEDQRAMPVGAKPVQAGPVAFAANANDPAVNRMLCGGSGLVSTIGDYLRFLQMLLNGGELDGARLLQADTVATMTRNHIGNLGITFPGHGDGFGYGFGVLTPAGKADDPATVGTYSWGGIYNTYYWVDPAADLIGVLMCQIFPSDHLTIRTDFKAAVYAACQPPAETDKSDRSTGSAPAEP